MASDGTEPLYRESRPYEVLAYEQAVNAVQAQTRSIDELRSRTGVLIASTSLVVSFLGTAAIKANKHPGLLAAIGIALFVMGVVTAVLILVPTRDKLRLTINANTVLAIWDENGVSEDGATASAPHRKLAADLQNAWTRNKAVTDRWFSLFTVSCSLLIAQTVAWAWLLWKGVT